MHLYQKYLQDQAKGSRLNASELRAGGGSHNSPQHLTASMKRKTISQLNISKDITEVMPSGSRSTGSLPARTGDSQGDTSADADVKSAKAEANAAARAVMHDEMVRDAKTRRDAIVQQRKWLQTLPIHERLAHQRQQNALRRWQQINCDWEAFKTRACKKTGKSDQELVMSRATKYREQVEMLDALQKARPLADKVGGDIWLVSLRGDGTRFVPVGNIFSGLFCPIRESTRLGPRVRRPLDHYDPKSSNSKDYEELNEEGSENSKPNASSKPVPILEKRSLELLAKKKRRLRKQLQLLLPHEVEDSASSRLVVETMDLFEWASRSNASSSMGGTGGSAATLSLPLEQDDFVAESNKGSLPSSARSEANELQLIGPSLRIAVEGEDEEDRGQLQLNGDDAPMRLSFYGNTSELVQRSVILMNDGSTVLHYQWTRSEFSHPSITPHLTGYYDKARNEPLNTDSSLRSNQDEEHDHRANNTFVSQAQGCILPGESERFVFGFTSPRPGLFLEKWLLDVDPSATIRFCSASAPAPSTTGDNTSLSPQSPRAAETLPKFDYKPVELHLKCTAVDNFVPTKQHMAQKSEIYKKQTVFMVEQLVEDLLRNVHSPPKVEFPELSAATKEFYELNHDAFGDVYFSEALVAQCRALYAQARQVLAQAASTHEALPVSGDATAIEADGAIVDAQGTVTPHSMSSDAAVPDSARPATSSSVVDSKAVQDANQGAPSSNEGEWDLRLSTLRAATREADDRNAAKLKALTAELKKTIEMEDDEEEEEEEDDDEEEEEDEDEDEDDSEDDDDEPCVQGSKPIKKQTVQEKREARAARREQVRQERRDKCQNLNESIALLRPQLQDAFRAMYLEAFAAPYDSSTLRRQLAQCISHLCSEVPVIHAITRMQQQLQSGATNDAREKETEKGVGQLLTRAVDEAVAWDLAYQLQYEHERKRFQRVLLSEKLTFEQALGQGGLEICFEKGVLVLQVDLDLANWFTLVNERASASAVGGASSADKPSSSDPLTTQSASETQLGLQWQFSSELLERDDFVPDKVGKAAQCVAALMQLIQGIGDDSSTSRSSTPTVKAIVLVSDLGSPPLTKPMKKLLGTTVKQRQAIVAGTEKIDQDREERRILDSIAHQLTLEPVSRVLERVISSSCGEATTIDFCVSLNDLTTKLSSLTLTASEDPSDIVEANEDAGPAALNASSERQRSPPKLILMENVKTLAAPNGGKRKSSDAGEKPQTPAVASQSAPAAVAPGATVAPTDFKATALARKKSVVPGAKPVADPKATAATPTLPAIPAAAPIPEPAPTPLAEEKPVSGDSALGSASAARLQAETIGLKLSELCDAFVVDVLLPPPWENVFVSTFHEHQESKKPVMLGPNLMEKFGHWAQILQPSPSNKIPATTMTTAIVGGKNLAGKLRLIDNLLEVADAIYFVGDVALSLYRVLFTKHDDTRRRWRKLPPRSPLSLWSVLFSAVEKLKQKAQRKCVKLLLPVDWIVGDTSLDEQDTSDGQDDDDDDDEDDNDDSEEEDEQDGNRGSRRKSIKSKRRKNQHAKKPIVEPNEVDSWRSKSSQWQYSGERAHVGMTTNKGDKNAWISVFDVDYELFTRFRVLTGNSSILMSKASGDDEEDDENGDEDEAEHDKKESDPSNNDGVSIGLVQVGDAQVENRELDASQLDNPTAFEFEWTFRAFDVGPLSMQILLKSLHQQQEQQQASGRRENRLILHGLFGLVECQEFDRATRKFVSFLEGGAWSFASLEEDVFSEPLPVPSSRVQDPSSNQQLSATPQLLLSGESTLEWIQRFENETRLKTKPLGPPEPQPQPPVAPRRKLVTNQDRKMAAMVRDLLACKPNATLKSFDRLAVDVGQSTDAKEKEEESVNAEEK